jgi:hypothetical protein
MELLRVEIIYREVVVKSLGNQTAGELIDLQLLSEVRLTALREPFGDPSVNS